MSMCRCPKCGEMYSTSYKTCPFCEEDEAWVEGRPMHRKGSGRRMAGRKEPSILGPLLVVIIIILAGVLAYFLFGDKIAQTLGLGQTPPSSSVMEPPSIVTPQPSTQDKSDADADNPDADADNPDIVPPTVDGGGGGTTGDTADTGLDFAAVAKLPKTLTLSKFDFTLPVGDPPVQLKVKDGGTGYSWISEDEGIASVDANGVVTAISSGDIKVMAYTETGMGVCIVRVRGGAAKPDTITPPTTGTTKPTGDAGGGTGTGTATLSKVDFTLPVGDPPVQLKIKGSTSAVTWSVDKSTVATVSASGVVTAVAKGTAIVTASVDGKALTCVVRVR